MKTKSILKTVLGILLLIAGITLVLAILKIAIVYISGFPNFLIDQEMLDNNPLQVKSLVILNVINQSLFFICILFLRKVARIYQDQKSVYQLKILGYLKIAGWCLLIFSGSEIIIRVLEIFINPDAFKFAGIASAQKSALLAVLAILMIRLSTVFKKTVESNKENEFSI
jgi:hypothetical protein